MAQVIVFKQDDGRLSVIHPHPDALAEYGIQAIAQKDVPSGKPYKIMDSSAIPADRALRDAWDIDPALLTDGIGADWSSF